MNYWVFQYTTNIYKNVVEDLDSGKLKRWEVTKHRGKIRIDDKVLLYIGGTGAKFIYGSGEIASELYQRPDGRFFIDLKNIVRFEKNLGLHEAKKKIPTLKIGISGTNFSSCKNEFISLNILANETN